MNYFERSAHDEAGRRINPHLPGDGTMPSNLATAWSWFVEGALWAHNLECDECKARCINSDDEVERLRVALGHDDAWEEMWHVFWEPSLGRKAVLSLLAKLRQPAMIDNEGWKARALNAIADLEKLPPILERIKAMRLPEQPPDRDRDDEWHAYVHANAVNRTVAAVLALFDVSRQEPVGSFSDRPAANLVGPEGDTRPEQTS